MRTINKGTSRYSIQVSHDTTVQPLKQFQERRIQHSVHLARTWRAPSRLAVSCVDCQNHCGSDRIVRRHFCPEHTGSRNDWTSPYLTLPQNAHIQTRKHCKPQMNIFTFNFDPGHLIGPRESSPLSRICFLGPNEARKGSPPCAWKKNIDVGYSCIELLAPAERNDSHSSE